METPICVVDAKTFVDNIHDIKCWIYNRQLRLVVPSGTTEQVEQIYQKTKETKPAPKEAARPKPFGKPAKIEYPPFDLNPLLAKNFLARLKTWKEEDAASEQRLFFQEKENHEAVVFQQSSEQYTPWKDLEIEEEKPPVAEDRPTTWAEALRRKQNLANGIVENSQALKGPAKPKLVAKAAGAESSPWKIKRDAPKISAKDVPANLRSLMSCTLWRLHESIDRNDANELFLLSDETAVQNVARKLNITVRSTKELGVLVAAKAKRPELDTFGDLEREFGIRSRSKQTNGKISHPNTKNDDLMKHEEKLNDSLSNDGTAKIEISHLIDGGEQKASERIEVGSCNGTIGVGKNDVEQKTTESFQVEEPSVSLAEDGSSTELPSGQFPPHSIDDSSHKASIANGTDHDQDQSQGVLGAAVDATEALPSNKAATPDGLPSQQTASDTAMPKASSAAIQAPSSSTQAEQESEDSEEDIVVFVPQPKRSSVQKKPTQQSSRPSTPLTQPQQQKAADRSPRSEIASRPKPPSNGRNPTTGSQGHPQPTAAPTVIDPDSFGRSLAVNSHSSPRAPHNPRSNHRPRPSLENSLFAQGPRGPRQALSRTHSPRISPTPSEAKDQTAGLQSDHVQRTSPPKRSRALETASTGPRGRGPNHANPTMQQPIQQKSLNTRMVESEEFVPRSAFPEAKLDPIGTPKATATEGATEGQHSVPIIAESTAQTKSTEHVAHIVSSDSFVPRSRVHIPPARQHTPKSNVNFVTRNGVSASPINQRAAEIETNEPKASMPEVQYVLKSGSTRAATRGRGRLWIPS